MFEDSPLSNIDLIPTRLFRLVRTSEVYDRVRAKKYNDMSLFAPGIEYLVIFLMKYFHLV